jgi:hypothetical protein
MSASRSDSIPPGVFPDRRSSINEDSGRQRLANRAFMGYISSGGVSQGSKIEWQNDATVMRNVIAPSMA